MLGLVREVKGAQLSRGHHGSRRPNLPAVFSSTRRDEHVAMQTLGNFPHIEAQIEATSVPRKDQVSWTAFGISERFNMESLQGAGAVSALGGRYFGSGASSS